MERYCPICGGDCLAEIEWDEIEHKLMEDLYGVRLDRLDLGQT